MQLHTQIACFGALEEEQLSQTLTLSYPVAFRLAFMNKPRETANVPFLATARVPQALFPLLHLEPVTPVTSEATGC